MYLDWTKPLEEILSKPGKIAVGLNFLETSQSFFEGIDIVDFFDVEGMFATCKDDVHYNPHCPNIDTFSIFLLCSNFRRHKNERTNMIIITGIRKSFLIAKSEINNFYALQIIWVFEQNVWQFQVSVDDTFFVNVANSAKNSLHNHRRFQIW